MGKESGSLCFGMSMPEVWQTSAATALPSSVQTVKKKKLSFMITLQACNVHNDIFCEHTIIMPMGPTWCSMDAGRCLGGPPAFVMFVTNAFFLAAWDPQTPLKAAILSGVTNLLLDLLLVNVFGWGIAGAAIATVAAQARRTHLAV